MTIIIRTTNQCVIHVCDKDVIYVRVHGETVSNTSVGVTRLEFKSAVIRAYASVTVWGVRRRPRIILKG